MAKALLGQTFSVLWFKLDEPRARSHAVFGLQLVSSLSLDSAKQG